MHWYPPQEQQPLQLQSPAQMCMREAGRGGESSVNRTVHAFARWQLLAQGCVGVLTMCGSMPLPLEAMHVIPHSSQALGHNVAVLSKFHKLQAQPAV